EGQLEQREGLLALTAVEQRLADQAGQLADRGVITLADLQLELAHLGDHLEAPELAIDLASPGEGLHVVRIELPGPLIQGERPVILQGDASGARWPPGPRTRSRRRPP